MLLVVCPNLCLDRIVVVRGFVPGRVHRAESAEELASGKGLNVARAARALGLQVDVVGIVGDGPAAHSILGGARAHGVRLQVIRVSGPVRVCTLIIDPGKEETVINEPGPPVGAREVSRLQRRVRRALREAQAVVLAGSLPPGVPPSLYAQVIRQAPGIPTILDAAGEALRLGLAARPFLVKVNHLELQEALARPLQTVEEIGQAAGEILDAAGGGVLITLGAQGALLCTAEGRWQIMPPEVHRVSTIGAGDSLTAGLVAGLLRGQPLLEATRLGMAAAAADVATLLPGTIDGATVKGLVPKVGVRAL
ncbi:MAG: 1-phosphofructokinase family hexose kinase [Armatimonadota bacterium]|nr:1-phosphofructokinase family hexose kinase [Armatimonadota bacterium]MDR7465086.1 1-phosphofructokinase family hexose kinase [Armatimonadota bacterium]MDR7470665.1 1-phosphofructokinase family hexose kinase [Armatimonadota bacterium]MDR7475298.1 1-phosphofructokinase family hexose kinase [Armatimonadota bacterium]MDR7539909.1 1-phosphofructokinase family hexose kinase [Armatimonadota bacterium]